MKKKLLSVLLTVAMTMSLCACGSTGQEKASGDSAGGEKVLTMWTIAVEGDSSHHAYQAAIADYEAANPGVKIEMEAFENESYKTKIKAAVAANELPDIYFSWGGGFSEAFVEAGKVLKLDDYYANYKSELPQGTLSYATYNNSLYGVPYVVSISGIFYNKKMFEENNLSEPKTWDELLNVCQTFQDKGITPFGVSVKEAWVMAMFNDALTLKCVGPEKLDKAFTENGQSYRDEDFMDAANKLQQLFDSGAFKEAAAGLSNDEAVAEFLNGTVPMFVTGAWLDGSIQSGAANPEDYSFMLFPACSDNAVLTDSMGGAQDLLMVNPEASDVDLAATAAFEIAKSVSKYGYQDGAGIAAWKVDYDVEGQSSISQKMSELVNEANSLTVWSGTLMSASDYTDYQTLLQEFFVGNLDSQGFVDKMDEILSE